MRYRPEDLERAFFSARFSRVLDSLGYARSRHWCLYGEESRRRGFHLVGIGPYQTIATALREDPALSERLLGLTVILTVILTVMGGIFDESGFPAGYRRALEETGLPPAWVDHNAQSDPEAALICARSGMPMTWVTAEVTLRAPMSREVGARFGRLGGPLGESLARMLAVWHEEWFGGWLPGYEGPPPDPEGSVAYHHDALTVYSVFADRHTDRWLELREGRVEYGLFRIRPSGHRGEATARVSVGVDGSRFEEFLVSQVEASFGVAAGLGLR